MKKGCFLKLIVILTILTAIVLYIVQNKFDDWVLKPGKGFLSEFTDEQLREELSYIKESPEKDSLIIMAKNFLSDKYGDGKYSDIDQDKAESILQEIAGDSIVTPNELVRLKLFIERSK